VVQSFPTTVSLRSPGGCGKEKEKEKCFQVSGQTECILQVSFSLSGCALCLQVRSALWEGGWAFDKQIGKATFLKARVWMEGHWWFDKQRGAYEEGV
jgi:hypothetical protein